MATEERPLPILPEHQFVAGDDLDVSPYLARGLVARRSPLASACKRGLDVTLAAVALIVLAPLLLVISLVLLVAAGRPILFQQLRPGLGGIPFTLRKFRTMRRPWDGEEGDGQRLTRLGSFLRRTSLDELPELWNVLRGEMSLVGPRPLLMDYLELYDAQQARRHEVRPGLTGLAQVRGRNALNWEEKFEMDVWYVDHWTLALDLKILAGTVLVVFRREGISQLGSPTTEPFRGTPPQKP
ncbi:MAG: sugar transferase [Planctomycetes bacterium]|nr:sugar transferase [Planctomycetota bacterium]